MRAIVSRVQVAGFDALALENSQLRAVVIPCLGGRVWELVDKVRDRQWIWHREGVALAATAGGSSYDDVWAGGWEELFPNDAPGRFEGRALPDHGEWWTTAWRVAEASDGDEAVVRLVADTTTRRAACVKEFRLAGSGATIHASYRIESAEPEAFHFLFKQHLPIAITSSCRLVLPGGRVTAVDPAFGTILNGRGPFEWPLATGHGKATVDLTRVPPRSEALREFVYVDDLTDGWCGVDDPRCGASLRFTFDRRHLPYVWLFLTYGGWRDCYTAVLEPCTNMPKDLAEASRLGRSAILAPGGIFETHAAVTLGAVAPSS